MNYEDMSDFEINKAVLLIQDVDDDIESITCRNTKLKCINSVAIVKFKGIEEPARFNPCNNPSDAWPIIVENAISIQPVHDVAAGGYYKLSEIKYWTAWATNRQSVDSFTEDKNPLRAAMICFLKMKDAENDR